MAISDCKKCWDTPCSCGFELRHESVSYLEKAKKIIERAIEFKKTYPDTKFSEEMEKDTEGDKAFMAFIRGELKP